MRYLFDGSIGEPQPNVPIHPVLLFGDPFVVGGEQAGSFFGGERVAGWPVQTVQLPHLDKHVVFIAVNLYSLRFKLFT